MIAELYTVYRTELLKYCCMICGNVSDAFPIWIFWKNWEKKNDGPGCIRWPETCSMMPAEGGQ